jgi:hypothetical protein
MGSIHGVLQSSTSASIAGENAGKAAVLEFMLGIGLRGEAAAGADIFPEYRIWGEAQMEIGGL